MNWPAVHSVLHFLQAVSFLVLVALFNFVLKFLYFYQSKQGAYEQEELTDKKFEEIAEHGFGDHYSSKVLLLNVFPFD